MIKSSGPIKYRRLKSGGYELLEDAWLETGIRGNAFRIVDERTGLPILEMDQHGRLTVRRGYRWDGASGPVIDRRTNMRAGLFHDALYQPMRARKLSLEFRQRADELYDEVYCADGGWGWVGTLDYLGLRIGAGYAAKPQPEVEVQVLTAP